jgi:hypothetical protein
MPTLWQMLTKSLKGATAAPAPKTQVIANPLKAKVGSSVQFDVLDYRDMTFFVREVREVTRFVGSKNFPFVDYTLLARPLGGDDVTVKLRLMPVTNPQPGDDLTHNVLLLTKHDELPYNDEFKNGVLAGEEFVINQDDVETGRYWRINDVKGSYEITAKIVDETNEKKDGAFTTEKAEQWDFWREFKDEADQPTKEYVYIEMNKSDGYFTIWKGQEINARRVDVR